MVTMAEERRQEHRERGLRFEDVRDQTGRLLFRVSRTGIVEIKVRGQFVLINLWQFLTEGEERE
jgi:hypothetical protein